MDSRLLREINRLFDELVHDPWRRALRPPAPASTEGTALLLEVPLEGARVESIVTSLEGRRLVVEIVLTRERRGSEQNPPAACGLTPPFSTDASWSSERFRQSFEIPAEAFPSRYETRFEGGVLRLRVTLRRREV